MFDFCVKCCHTLCLLTCINIKGHYILYLTSPNWIYANMFLLSTFSSVHVSISYFCNLHMWINTIFSHADIAGSFRVSLVVRVHSIWAHGGGESFLVLLCVFSINLRFRFRLQDQVQVLYTTGSLISSSLLVQSLGFCKRVPQPIPKK